MQLNKIAIIGLILGIGGGIIGMSVSIISETLATGMPLVSGFILLIFVVVFGWVFWAVFRPMLQARALLKSGEPAEAVILKLWDTGVTLNDNPQVGMLLEVRPPDREPFQVETKMIVSRLQTSMVQPGMMVQVRYDPNDASKVAIESFGGRPASEIPTGAITVDGQVYASVDELPPHARQAYEKAMTVFGDANGDGVPDILEGRVQVVDLRSQEASNRQQRLKELRGLLDAELITEEEYEARKAEILSEI